MTSLLIHRDVAGGTSAGALGEFLELARNKESSGLPRDAQGMVGSLLAVHEALIRNLRSDLGRTDESGDAGTNDFGGVRTNLDARPGGLRHPW